MEGLEELKHVFKEEAVELLAELETVALELECSPSDASLIDRAFRVLHTLKGASTMYGFTDAAGLAHEIEGVYDAARTDACSVPAAIVGLTLQVKDCIRDLVFAQSAEDVASAKALATSLASECRRAESVEGRGGSAAGTTTTAGADSFVYDITLAPGADAMRRGLNVLGMLDDLEQLGHVEVSVQESIPTLETLDHDRAYVSWRIALTTDAPRDAVDSVFMFMDPSEFGVDRVEDAVADSPRKSGGRAGADAASDFVRVAAPKLDRLVNLVGELVTAHAAMGGLAAASGDPVLAGLSEEVGRLTAEMRESVLDIRMVPIGSVFGRFRRHVRDLGLELGKNVEIVTEGGETELDKTVIDRIEKPLLHLLRNSLDHGIESPDTRRRAGKSASGTITITASQSGGSVFLVIADDGKGLDRAAIRAKAHEAGLVSPDEDLGEDDVYNLLFRPGFSTAGTVTNISGRGVGLDVVKRTIQELQGAVTMAPRSGGGTEVTLRLPLTLAIVEALLVSVGEERFMIPLGLVEECVEVDQQDVWRDHGRSIIDVRGEIVPFVRLREFFSVPGPASATELAVIVSISGRRFGLVVDAIEDQLQAVMKNLGRQFGHTEGVSGASILGNGTIALVLDAGELMRLLDGVAEGGALSDLN